MKKIKYFFLIVVLTSVSLIACDDVTYFGDTVRTLKNSVNFTVIGDWGRNGDYLQKETAVQLNKTVGDIGASFIISTGDNFYENGIASVDDPQWWSSFEEIYRGANLFINWYVVLGNHDYHGSAKAQIDYSKKSRRWRMPSYYFAVERKIPGSNEKILFLYLDTNQFEKKYYSNPEKYGELLEQKPEKQLAWIDSVLTNNKSAWKIVVGHHHVYTGGSRKGEVSEAGEVLEPILKKYNVNAYFCGHEHDLQYIVPKGKTHYIISGAGSALRPTGKIPETVFSISENGFAAVSVSLNEMLMQFVNYKGEVIYSTIIPR